MSNNSLSVIILAAGKGSRMKSDLPKVMHKVAGCEMINHVINNAKILKPKNINIIASSEIMQYCNDIKQDHSDINLNFIIQHEKLGTGHALKIALQNITQQDLGQKIIILYADTPLVSSQTIDNLIAMFLYSVIQFHVLYISYQLYLRIQLSHQLLFLYLHIL